MSDATVYFWFSALLQSDLQAWAETPRYLETSHAVPLPDSAELYQAFEQDVPLRESFFLADSARAHAHLIDSAARLLIRIEGQEPDHLAAHFATLGEALTNRDRERARQVAQRLAWTLPLAAASVEGSPWIQDVMALAIELLQWQSEELGIEEEAPSLALLEEPSAITLDDASLREIARALALPALSGHVLTRKFLVGLGRDLDLPTGFGSRAEVLEALLQGAFTEHKGEALLTRLTEHIAVQRERVRKASWMRRVVEFWELRWRAVDLTFELIHENALARHERDKDHPDLRECSV